MAKNIIDQALQQEAEWKERIAAARRKAEGISRIAENDKADMRFLRFQAENQLILESVALKAPEWNDYFLDIINVEEEEAKEMLAAQEMSDAAFGAEIMKLRLLTAF